jgi:hypothetical protein
LLLAAGTIRVIGGEQLLGKNVEAGEKTNGLVEVEIADVASSFLIKQFQRQEREQSGSRGYHLRARIPRIDDEAVETELGQQRQEQEDTCDASTKCAAGREVQLALVSDFRRFGVALIVAAARS